MLYFDRFRGFTRCRFQNLPVRVPFSKPTFFKICWKSKCPFRINGRPIRKIFHRFDNVPALCECSIKGQFSDKQTSDYTDRAFRLSFDFTLRHSFVRISLSFKLLFRVRNTFATPVSRDFLFWRDLSAGGP